MEDQAAKALEHKICLYLKEHLLKTKKKRNYNNKDKLSLPIFSFYFLLLLTRSLNIYVRIYTVSECVKIASCLCCYAFFAVYRLNFT